MSLLTTPLLIPPPSPLLSLTDPDCESVPPWARSLGGVRLRPCDRQPAFSSCAEPVVMIVVRAYSSSIVVIYSPSIILHAPKTYTACSIRSQTGHCSVPLSCGADTRGNPLMREDTSSCRLHPRRNSQHSSREPPARRESSGKDLENRKVSFQKFAKGKPGTATTSGGIVCFRTGLRKGGKRTTYRH